VDLSVIVTTYQKPRHLRLCLASIAGQLGVQDCMEVIVSDDGSTDETADIVQHFARSACFPVAFVTHPHDGFQVSKVRNQGAAASRGRFLVFFDGDCIFPQHHLATLLRLARPKVVLAGDCCRLDEDLSSMIDEATVRDPEQWQMLRQKAPQCEVRRLAKQHRKALLYSFLRHPRKPKIVGNNFGICRDDFFGVNGFDETFVGWGYEDDDLGIRLRRIGVRIRSVLNCTYPYHIWHRRDPSAPATWKQGEHVAYLHQKNKPVFCENGVVKKSRRQAA